MVIPFMQMAKNLHFVAHIEGGMQAEGAEKDSWA
jgi:hypothetical protein